MLRPRLMNELSGEFSIYLMVPPDTKISYFFTNPVIGVQTIAKNQLLHELPEDEHVN